MQREPNGRIRPDYTQTDLTDAIREVGIKRGDVVSLQVSISRLGIPDAHLDVGSVSGMLVSAFREVMGPEGTLVVPTYTYSFGRGEAFDVARTPSTIGDFTEWFRLLPEAKRSRDPMLSSAGIGPLTSEILRCESRSCFGPGSTFDQLKMAEAKICTLGIELHWATFRHHIEESAEVPFRFHKVFTGTITENGTSSVESWTYFAAPFLTNCEANGIQLQKMLLEAGLARSARIGRGFISSVSAMEYFNFGLKSLAKDPWLTAVGPPCSDEQMKRHRDVREH